MPEITLLTRDGTRHEFPCPETGTVLDAAEAAGLYLPSMCREGSCGACRASVSDGAYTQATEGDAAANPGDVLLCRCHPESDLVVDLPYPDADILRHSLPRRDAVIEALEPAGSGAMALSLSFAPDDALGQMADFIPGQYFEVTIPEALTGGAAISRAYSLANLPNWDGRLDFLIRLAPGGAFSTWLGTQAKPGDTLQVRGPLGRFVLDEASIAPRCLVAGGCGLAPILSMLRHLAEFQDMQKTTLIFGANTESELFATEEIEALKAALPMLEVVYAVWHPEGAWSGFTGTAGAALDAHLRAAAEAPDVYVCGPPRLVTSVFEVAATHGVPADRMFTENMQAR